MFLIFTTLEAIALGSTPSPLPSFDPVTGELIKSDIKSIISPNTLYPIETVLGTTHYEMAKIVARVETSRGSGFCTGSRIAKDLILTNHHCADNAGLKTIFHFGYEKESLAENRAKFKTLEIVIQSLRNDFAIFRVAPLSDVDAEIAENYPIATLSRKSLSLNQLVLVPGHPNGDPKKIDISEQCRLTRVETFYWSSRNNIQHQCDTLGGSSGSPVIDRDTGHIIALHWGGTGGYRSNHAIPITSILDYLKDRNPDLLASLTLAEY